MGTGETASTNKASHSLPSLRAAMDSDEEIFLTQNTFSQEPFSPELNLEELVGDFREVSERDSVEVEKKENPGRNIVDVCDNEVEKCQREVLKFSNWKNSGKNVTRA